MTARTFLLVALMLMTACSTVTTSSLHNFGITVPGRYTGSSLNCHTATKYSYKKRYEGYYKGYASTIDSQVDLTNRNYTADDIAMIGYLVVEVSKTRFPSIDTWRHVALQAMFSHTHVIVAKDFDSMNAIWGGGLKRNVVARTTRSIYSCFEPQNNTWFYTIIASHFRTQDTVVHEAMHPASLVMHGDVQSEHTDPRYWDEYGRESLQALVEKRYRELKDTMPAMTPSSATSEK